MEEFSGSTLLMDSKPLLVLPELVKYFDSNIHKALMLQQFHWWCRRSKHTYDGYNWFYASYAELSKTFFWITTRTIKRYVLEMEESNDIISGNFNKMSIDRTKWYRVNYQTLQYMQDTIRQKTATYDPNWIDHGEIGSQPRGKRIPIHGENASPPITKDLQRDLTKRSSERQTNFVSRSKPTQHDLYFLQTHYENIFHQENYTFQEPEEKALLQGLQYVSSKLLVKTDITIDTMPEFLEQIRERGYKPKSKHFADFVLHELPVVLSRHIAGQGGDLVAD